jgi:hypothetical protein
MKGCLYVVRDQALKLTLPGPSVTIQRDGTIWYQGIPLTGATDPDVRARIVTACKAKRYQDIPRECMTKMGDNPSGLWAGDAQSWSTHPARIAAERAEAQKLAAESSVVSIYLSSRGWGDYSPCTWTGDITRPDAEILSECRQALASAIDVDRKNLTDTDLLHLIVDARVKRSAPRQEPVETKHGQGYCSACESYCYGDCGNYRPGK